MAWHEKIVERSIFILVFTLLAVIGFAATVLGISGNELAENIINAAIATIVAVLVTKLVMLQERKRTRS